MASTIPVCLLLCNTSRHLLVWRQGAAVYIFSILTDAAFLSQDIVLPVPARNGSSVFLDCIECCKLQTRRVGTNGHLENHSIPRRFPYQGSHQRYLTAKLG